MKKIQKGDAVVVRAGKFKGTQSTVVAVAGERVVVKGVNTVKKAVKGKGFVEKDAPIHVSNVMLFDAKGKKASPAGVRKENGKNVRFYKKGNELVNKAQ